jgi:hypothetical protein
VELWSRRPKTSQALYDVGVLSDRGMLPGLDGIPAAAVLDRLSLLRYRNAELALIEAVRRRPRPGQKP